MTHCHNSLHFFHLNTYYEVVLTWNVAPFCQVFITIMSMLNTTLLFYVDMNLKLHFILTLTFYMFEYFKYHIINYICDYLSLFCQHKFVLFSNFFWESDTHQINCDVWQKWHPFLFELMYYIISVKGEIILWANLYFLSAWCRKASSFSYLVRYIYQACAKV